MKKHTLPIDDVMTSRDPFCSYCGKSDDETGTPMKKYGTLYEGRLYYSGPLCSVECHDEAYTTEGEA